MFAEGHQQLLLAAVRLVVCNAPPRLMHGHETFPAFGKMRFQIVQLAFPSRGKRRRGRNEWAGRAGRGVLGTQSTNLLRFLGGGLLFLDDAERIGITLRRTQGACYAWFIGRPQFLGAIELELSLLRCARLDQERIGQRVPLVLDAHMGNIVQVGRLFEADKGDLLRRCAFATARSVPIPRPATAARLTRTAATTARAAGTAGTTFHG